VCKFLRYGWRAAAIGVPLLLAACARHQLAISDRGSASGILLYASDVGLAFPIKELMDSTVDPSADRLWDSVATVSTLAGTERRQPRTAEEWKTVKADAITLIESMNLLVMEGRHAAPVGTQAGDGELTPQQIDERLASNRAVFVGFAHALQAETQKALEAIEKRDAAALLDAGGNIDEACEACHLTFWYPNQGTPNTL
jgi:cytochrome c556